jgi:hypothetical protein
LRVPSKASNIFETVGSILSALKRLILKPLNTRPLPMRILTMSLTIKEPPMLKDIKTAEYPLERLVEAGFTQLGLTTTSSAVGRYTALLEAAIKADEGESIERSSWADFIGNLEGENKFEAAIKAVAPTLGASEQQANQFLAMSYAAVEVLDGADIDVVEAELAEELEQPEGAEELEPYLHLDDEGRQEQLAHIARQTAPDPDRPEPPHLAEEEE